MGNNNPPAPDKAIIRRHLDVLTETTVGSDLHDGLVEIAWGTFDPAAGRPLIDHARLFALGEIEQAVALAARVNAVGNQVYVGAALRKPETARNRRTGKSSFYGSFFAWTDEPNWQTLRQHTSDCPANLIICTGREPEFRGQLFWRLAEPITDPTRLEAINSGIGHRLQADDVFNCDRVMRLAGTVNWPLKPGRTTPELVDFKWVNGEGSTTDPVLAWKVYAEPSKASGNGATTPTGERDIFGRVDLDKAFAAAREPGKWHRVVRDVVMSLVGRGAPDDIVQAVCRGFTSPGWTPEQTRSDVAKMLKGARAKHGGPTFDRVDMATPPKPPIKIVTGAEFLAMSFTPAEDILGPWLRVKTLAMLYGPRGEGKTYLVLAIALAIISGGEFLGWKAPKSRRVLLIDGEMQGAVMQERLRALRKGVSAEDIAERLRIINPDVQEAFALSLSRSEDQSELAEALDWAEIIILDNLACLTSGDENDREAWLPMQGFILRLRTKGKTVLLVHHAGKTGDQRGSSSKEDVLDTIVKLRRPTDYEDEQGLRVEWHFTKHRGFHGNDAMPREVQLEDKGAAGGITWKWSPLEDSLLKQLVELLKEPKATERSVAQIMEISPARVHRLKKKAKAKGWL